MQAIGYYHNLSIDNPSALIDIELPKPTPTGRDLLVAVQAVSVNPIDIKVRKALKPENGQAKILGWDAVGIVEAVGTQVSLFKPGDKVWYAGSLARAGSNSEYQLVDERIVSLAPKSLTAAEAAALPLTAITAWELLFDRLELDRRNIKDKTMLIIGAAGGVGSILTQLAKHFFGDLKIIGTASRPESQAWIKQLGADFYINHHQPFGPQLKAMGVDAVDYVMGLTHTVTHWDEIVACIKPQGKLAIIDDIEGINIVTALKPKSISVYLESMFTRSVHHTEDQIQQHELLDRVARLVDNGIIKTTLQKNLGAINAENLRRAHALIETHGSIGKVVLEGFTH